MGASREVLVLHPYFWFGNGRFSDIVKRAWARVVLGWVTSWEVLVLHPYFWFGNGRFSDIALVGAAYKDGGMYGSSKFVMQEMTGAIIPALIHRIQSELRSQACLGESSTRMGDLVGSPRVEPLFLVCKFVTQEMTGEIIPALMHRIPSELRKGPYRYSNARTCTKTPVRNSGTDTPPEYRYSATFGLAVPIRVPNCTGTSPKLYRYSPSSTDTRIPARNLGTDTTKAYRYSRPEMQKSELLNTQGSPKSIQHNPNHA
ncbi:hypothetical protein V6N12_046607 [Hibiscus sabdariffa]|uniref:Uncharacterized protein n=1 Tax=Hibiscus sabdariffa TaxID=183260 RepID=A0ABR2DK99_9ROSI